MPYTEAYVPIGHFPLGPATVSEFQCSWCNWQHMHARHTQKIHLYHWAVTDTSTATTMQSEDYYIVLPSNKKTCKISILGQPNGATKGLQDRTCWGFFRIKASTIAKKRWLFFCLVINALGKKKKTFYASHKHSTCLIFQAWKDLIAYCRPHITFSADLILLSCILQRTNIIKCMLTQNKLFHV